MGATIVSEYRVLGASLDWTRQRFTMDERYVRAVLTAFVAFYERGWIYRAPRIVNWCPHDQSAISDLEVEWQQHQDTLYFIKYPVEGVGALTIATVRPETMLADTGVAVNPEDERYKQLIGTQTVLPLQVDHRTADQRAVVAAHGGDAGQGARRIRCGQGALASRTIRADLPRLAARSARLEYRTAAVARPPRPGLLLRQRTHHRRGRPTRPMR